MQLSLRSHRPTSGMPQQGKRLWWALAVVVPAFLLLAGRLWQLQILDGAMYFERTTDNFIKDRAIVPVRGRIVDRHGKVIAGSRPSFNVYADPRKYQQKVHDHLVDLLAVGTDRAESAWRRMEAAVAEHQRRPVVLFEDVSWQQMALIEQGASFLSGVSVQDQPHRLYPYGPLASHVLGYMKEITKSELDAWSDEGYKPGDYVGRYGLEKVWEKILRGTDGIELYVENARGQRLDDADAEELIDGERLIAPMPGRTLVLTLDVRLQQIIQKALRDHPAAGVAVVEVRTGRIRALVSKPGFDSNMMTGRLTAATLDAMNESPYKPFLDKTLKMHYFPGSTFKFVTTLAALESKLQDPRHATTCTYSVRVGDRTFHCNRRHGKITMAAAMAQSCNVYFYELSQVVGIDRIAEVARDFGFGLPTGLDLNGDTPGRIPNKAFYEERGTFRLGYTLNTAIGQGDVEVSVLQLALAYAAIANGGRLWLPQLVERVESAAGDVLKEYPPRLRHRLRVSEEALIELSRGLLGTVNDKLGTAYGHRPEGFLVAGKTGTAQIRGGRKEEPDGTAWHPLRDHAWFAGYAPADDPEFAIVVLIEHGGSGGRVAAPIAVQILTEYFALTTTTAAGEAAP